MEFFFFWNRLVYVWLAWITPKNDRKLQELQFDTDKSPQTINWILLPVLESQPEVETQNFLRWFFLEFFVDSNDIQMSTVSKVVWSFKNPTIDCNYKQCFISQLNLWFACSYKFFQTGPFFRNCYFLERAIFWKCTFFGKVFFWI